MLAAHYDSPTEHTNTATTANMSNYKQTKRLNGRPRRRWRVKSANSQARWLTEKMHIAIGHLEVLKVRGQRSVTAKQVVRSATSSVSIDKDLDTTTTASDSQHSIDSEATIGIEIKQGLSIMLARMNVSSKVNEQGFHLFVSCQQTNSL